MDMNGWSSIHHENIAWDATTERAEVWPNVVNMATASRGLPGAAKPSLLAAAWSMLTG